ncbi:unnamed protein product [Malus baccata var. baccata]
MLQAEKKAIKSFPYWFEKHVNQLQQLGDPRATNDLVALTNGSSKWCQRYKIFVCNGIRFKSDAPSYASTCDWNLVIGLFDGTSRNTSQGVKTDRYGFRLDNFNKISSLSDPFILTSQALQLNV